MDNEFTYHEFHEEKIKTRVNFKTFEDIENEIKKYIKNIEISVVKENYDSHYILYIRADYDNYYHCAIKLQKNGLVYYFDDYLKNIAYSIADLISDELFIKKEKR